MPVMDEFKEEREALKHGTWKQKLSYFIDYYKWHVIITAAVLVIGISVVVEIVTQKETALYACLLNTVELYDTTEYAQSFAEYAGIDLNDNALIFDTSMTIETGQIDQTSILSVQKFMANVAAADLDVMITDSATMEDYANDDYFYDVRDFLTPEQAARFEPYFYYVDITVVQERLAARINLDDTYVPSYPDPRHPEDMDQPVPVGIYLEGENALKDFFYFRSDEVVISVFGNTSRPEAVSSFIDFLME